MFWVGFVACAVRAARAATLIVTGGYGRFNNVLIYFAKALLHARRVGAVLLFCADLELWTRNMDTTPNRGSLFDVFDFSELMRNSALEFLPPGDGAHR